MGLSVTSGTHQDEHLIWLECVLFVLCLMVNPMAFSVCSPGGPGKDTMAKVGHFKRTNKSSEKNMAQ